MQRGGVHILEHPSIAASTSGVKVEVFLKSLPWGDRWRGKERHYILLEKITMFKQDSENNLK